MTAAWGQLLTSKEGPIRQDLGGCIGLYNNCATADEMLAPCLADRTG